MKIINILSKFAQRTNDEYNYLLQKTKSKDFKEIFLPLKTCYLPQKCHLFTCFVRKNNDFVNIDFKESKSNCKNGTIIWKNIYKKNSNPKLRNFISGIHFSINTHVCYNYYDFIIFYGSSIEKYKKIRKYMFNFIFILCNIRECIKGTLKIKKSYIKNIEIIIKEISCIDCNKCKVLGTLQFEGFKACILKSNDEYLTKHQFIYLVLFYKKILRTLRYIMYLEKKLL